MYKLGPDQFLSSLLFLSEALFEFPDETVILSGAPYGIKIAVFCLSVPVQSKADFSGE